MKKLKKYVRPTQKKLNEWKEGLANSDEFGPMSFAVSSQYGPTAGAVWGVIHYYEARRNKVCMLSHASIGTLIGRGWLAVGKTIHLLIDEGLVELAKDNRRANKPNWYRTTDKVKLRFKIHHVPSSVAYDYGDGTEEKLKDLLSQN